MKQPIRLPLLLSAAGLFATACTPVPFEGQNNYTYGNTYTSPAPYSAPSYTANTPVPSTPIGNVAANTAPAPTRAPVPEAGPLSQASNNSAAPRPQTVAATHHTHSHGSHAHPGNTQGHAHNIGHNTASVPAAGAGIQHAANVPAANPTPVGTVPQVPAATGNVATASYTPPAATNNTPPAANGGSSYDTYAANTTSNTAGNNSYNTYAASSNNSYNYATDSNGNNAANTSYTSYGTASASNSAAANTANTSSNNYYAGANTSYDTYTNNTASSNNYATTSNASAGGSAAVQVFATVSRDKAERIRQDIASQGLPAIVDQVDGLYKVRVPYSTEGQARANLIKVRSVSGTPGAFVTSR